MMHDPVSGGSQRGENRSLPKQRKAKTCATNPNLRGSLANLRHELPERLFHLLRGFHFVLIEIVNFPPIIGLYLLVPDETFQRICLLYLALVSIWANVAGHWSAWISARVQIKQDEAND